MVRSCVKWLERLSVDAVLVGVLWGLALESSAGRPMRVGEIAVLALSTWLTYVADRLRDAQEAQLAAGTDRHGFHERNRRELVLAWLVVFTLAVIMAVAVLPGWKVLGGWVLVLGVVVYLWLLKQPMAERSRMLMKRLVMPLIFAAGVAWMTESWRTTEGIGAMVMLFGLALANVVLISCQENRGREELDWLWKLLGGALLGLLAAGNAALLLHWPSGLAGLACAAVYFGLMLRVKAVGVPAIRIWVDAVLAAAAVLVLILR